MVNTVGVLHKQTHSDTSASEDTVTHSCFQQRAPPLWSQLQ